jgi:hypothetical protein
MHFEYVANSNAYRRLASPRPGTAGSRKGAFRREFCPKLTSNPVLHPLESTYGEKCTNSLQIFMFGLDIHPART